MLRIKLWFLCFFFFQAEDGIRDYKVTGVQTCALPICASWQRGSGDVVGCRTRSSVGVRGLAFSRAYAGKTSDPGLLARDALDVTVRRRGLFCDLRAGRVRDAHLETLP